MTRAPKWSLSCCFQVAAGPFLLWQHGHAPGPTALAVVPLWKPKAWPRCRCTSTDEDIYRYPMLVGDWIVEVSQIKECCAMILRGWRVKEVGCLSQIVHSQIEVWIETKWRTWKRRVVLQYMWLLGWWSSADVANRSLDWNVWFSRCKAPCRERAFMLLRPGAEGSPEQNRSAQIGLVGQTSSIESLVALDFNNVSAVLWTPQMVLLRSAPRPLPILFRRVSSRWACDNHRSLQIVARECLFLLLTRLRLGQSVWL